LAELVASVHSTSVTRTDDTKAFVPERSTATPWDDAWTSAILRTPPDKAAVKSGPREFFAAHVPHRPARRADPLPYFKD